MYLNLKIFLRFLYLFQNQDNLIFQYTQLLTSKETQWQYYWNIEDFSKNKLKEPTYGKQIIKNIKPQSWEMLVTLLSNVLI